MRTAAYRRPLRTRSMKPSEVGSMNTRRANALAEITHASCTIVSNGYSTSGRWRLSRNQNVRSSSSRFSSEKRRYGGYIDAQSSAPAGGGTSNGLGNRRTAGWVGLMAPPFVADHGLRRHPEARP